MNGYQHGNGLSSTRCSWGPSPLKATIDDTSTSTAAPTPTDTESCVKTANILSLDSIRSTLIRQEETIIFAIIERAQFRQNTIIYENGGFGDLGIPPGVNPDAMEGFEQPLSFMDYMLIGTEVLHCGVRRYTSPEEHAFYPSCLPTGPLGALPTLEYPTDLLSPIGGASTVNFNPILYKKYKEWIVSSIAKPGDDEQHGSSAIADTTALQALSRRVHYGKFVAESKYRSDPEGYQRLVDAGDAEGVMELLTNSEVEARVLRRARIKAATYGREPLMTQLPDEKLAAYGGDVSFVAAAAASAVATAMEALSSKEQEGKIDPKIIEEIYRDFIIPLTKDVEVDYLFRRCGRDPPEAYAPDRMSRDVL